MLETSAEDLNSRILFISDQWMHWCHLKSVSVTSWWIQSDYDINIFACDKQKCQLLVDDYQILIIIEFRAPQIELNIVW